MKAITHVLGITLVCAALVGCNSHPVTLSNVAGTVEYQQRTSIDGSQKVDILWVVDNSGSMCQEQKVLRDNFVKFIEELNKTNLDFHIGITTTHMYPGNYAAETVAVPGHLQSTPQPVPGFDQSCVNAVDAKGQIIDGDFGPIRAAIAQAVACMQDPDPAAYNWSDADLDCVFRARKVGEPACSIPGVCSAGDCESEREALFPPQSAYRAIPKVLRSVDYKNGNVLDVDRLTQDFACASLVGTRGYGIEAGLNAAVEAVAPQNTGGAADGDPATIDTSAPNHGLIRTDATFALVFVTDENDCSNNGLLTIDSLKDPTRGEIDVTTGCQELACEYENVEGKEDTSLLLPVERLKEQLLANLAATKGRDEVGEGEVLVASIHGISKRFKAEDVPAACDSNTVSNITPSCVSGNGVAYTGDRYERFLRTFPPDNYFPAPSLENPDASLRGWLCSGDFGPALTAIGQLLNRDAGGCVTHEIMPCEGPMDDSCPPFPYTNEPGQCILLPNTNIEGPSNEFVPAKYYCNSGIQLRARVSVAGIDPVAKLTSSNYCIEASINDPGFPNGCVIAEDRFDWIACPSGYPGLRLQWNNEIEAINALNGTELQIRYNSATSDPNAVQ